MTLVATWLLFPLIMLALSVGCGLLLDTILGTRLPGVLLAGVGLALMIVVTQFLELVNGLAPFSTPAAVAMAVAGWGLSWRRRPMRMWRWPAVTALAVFAVYAAPIVLSGEATFAGYIKLDDTATWMAFTDWVINHGRSVSSLPPSTYQVLLQINLGVGYPIGIFLPLGIGHELVNQDVAWVIQPYMAFLGVLLTLALWSLVEPLVASLRLRAVAVFIAAQPALLYGYYLWGGIKEIATAAIVATGVAVVAWGVRALQSDEEPLSTRFAYDAVPLFAVLAVVTGALTGVLGIGGGVWLLPAILLVLVALWRLLGPAAALIRIAGYGVLAVILSLPVLIPGGLSFATGATLTSGSELGNLFAPLKFWQVAGVWPVGDFRLVPANHVVTYVLVGIAILAAIGGVIYAVRRGGWGLLTYSVGTVAAAVLVIAFASPWVDGKSLAIASPAIPLAAVVLAAFLWSGGRRVEGGILMAVLAVGILWSNALAYRDVRLAPRPQLAELETVGQKFAGEGPTLMTEYQPYGVRHFLRNDDAEGLSELRVRTIPLINGNPAPPHSYYDLDQINLDALLTYRTLVLLRNPSLSRPPAPYQLVWQGRYYEVWQRPAVGGAHVIDHLGLGSVVDPVGVPSCSDVKRLARKAGSNGTLAAVPRPDDIAVGLTGTEHPPSWNSTLYPTSLLPNSPGTITSTVQVKSPGVYTIWLGGSLAPETDLIVDGRFVDSVRDQLLNSGQYVLLGRAYLTKGSHQIQIQIHGADLHPGSGGAPFPIGPLVLSSSDPTDSTIQDFPPSRASELCGKTWDWIEALGPPAG
jgi:hypothetical protein